MKQIDTFIENWTENDSKNRQAFIEIYEHLKTLEDTTFEFNERPKISYSLRPKHANQKNKSLFAMVDIIDDEPDERWLSVCFYGEMISDPDETGDMVPEGLLGEDAHCFDLYEYDKDEIEYIKQRLSEAHASAKE